ncbi:MAG: methyltransferase domain-containing protein [Thermoproteus sp.]
MSCRLYLNRRTPCLSKEEAKALAEIYGCAVVEEGEMFVLNCGDCSVLKRAASARPLGLGRDGPSALAERTTVTMDYLTARLMANLARARPLAKMLEPFVGSGSIAREAERYGAYVVGVDIDAKMLRLAARNTSADLMQADARLLPFRRAAFDGVVGDAPYGRLSLVEGDVEKLIQQFLEEVASVIRRGFLVLALPVYFDVPYLYSCAMYVHGGLYRVIAVLEVQSGGGPS